jgi:hypothetical protein
MTDKTKSFIEKSIFIHGNHYDYSKVEYKNCDTHVILICKIHGEFLQTPYSHLKSKNCSRCRGHQKTTKQFIEESILIHGDKYDYSKVEYKNSTTKVIIICKIHGEIEQIPSSHLSGQGCYKCGNNTLKTKEQFIIDAKNIFGDKYDYSKVEYNGAHKKVIICCPEHGDFEMKPNCHLSNQGCYKCGRKEVSIKLSLSKKGVLTSNINTFIQKSILIHGDKYDYSKVEYKGFDKKVIIICKEHGEFLQSPKNHLHGNSCIHCGIILGADKNRKPLEQFIKEATEIHGDKYDYSKVETYNNNKVKVCIICKEHGEFLQTPNSHLSGQGCAECGILKRADMCRRTTDDFIKEAIEIHKDKYDYSKVKYLNTREKIIIICKKHGEFLQSPEQHIISKSGCPRCINKTEDKLCEKIQTKHTKQGKVFIVGTPHPGAR